MLKKTFVRQYVSILLGNILIAGAYSLICVPNNLINGGVTALSMIISKISDINITVCVNVLTLSLVIICGIFLGKNYLFSGIFSSICYVVIFSIGTYLPLKFYLNDFISVPIAALLVGIGYYICINAKSTTVGFDTIAIILNKKNKKIKIAFTMFLINSIVLISGLFTYGFIAIVKGIIFTFIQTYTLNFMLSHKTPERSKDS